MADASKVNGLRIIWRATASTSGATAESIKANITSIRSMVSVCTRGLMDESTRVIGSAVNSTDSEPTTCPRRTR
jgi:hypothetical protein